MATCANASIVTINNQNSNSSVKNTKTKEVKNSKNISGGGCSSGTECTINDKQTSTVTINGSENNSLTITSEGSINTNNNNNAINVNSGATNVAINNAGYVNGGVSNGTAINIGQNNQNGASIKDFINSGTIGDGNNKFAITVWGNSSNKSTIENFNNSGLIQSGIGEAIYLGNTTINNFTNSGTIKSSGGRGINIATGNTITNFENTGSIDAKTEAIYFNYSTLENLENSGTIKADGYGAIFVKGGSIGTIVNSGTIISTGANSGSAAIKLEGGGTIKNITNTGTIESNYDGISVSYGKFETLDIKNGGIIKAKRDGINISQWQKLGDLYVDNASIYGGESGILFSEYSTTSDISIQNGGKIYGGDYGMYFDHAILNENTTIAGENSAVHGGIAGIYLSRGSALNGTIEVKDKGMISSDNGGFGIVNADKAQIKGSVLIKRGGVVTGILNKDNAKIAGTIKVEGEGSSIVGGIINQDNGKIEGSIEVNDKGQIDSIINAGSGEISGSVKVDDHSKIENIINGALASSFYNNGVSTGKISGDVSVDHGSIVGSIINAGQGEITGGIKVDHSSEVTNISNSGNGLISSDVSVDNGSKVGNIINDDYGKITGDVSIGKDSSVDKIINSGHGSIGGNIINNGNLGSINNSGSITGSIENNNGDLDIKNDGDLGGSITVGENGGNTSISNGSNGNIGGGIVNNGNNDVNIDNQGTVKPDKDGNHITNNGDGNVNVGDWIVKPNEDGSFDGAINVGGNGSGSTNIDNITVDTSDPNFDASKPINPDNIVNNNTSGSGGVGKPGNVGSNNDLLNLVYDPISGTYKTLADVSAGVGSVMAQTLINTYMMRSFFLDTVLDDASRMAYKHARIHNNHKANKDLVGFDTDEHYHGFVLPYFSSNSIKLLGTNDYSKGHTKGIVAGFHTLKDIGMLGAYVGTEETNMDTKDYFSLKMQTVYAGLKYSNILLEDEIKEAFFKFHTKAAYTKNDVQKFVDKGKREANGNTDTYGYGASIGTGMNFYLDGVDNIITPEVSLNYEGGFTKAFSMHGDGALNHERYYKSELNLFSSTASLKWLNKWHPQISTSFEAGARINFNPEVESRVNFANLKASETLDLPRTYQYASASLIFSLAEDLEMSFNYNGTFANNSHSHTGFLQFDFIF